MANIIVSSCRTPDLLSRLVVNCEMLGGVFLSNSSGFKPSQEKPVSNDKPVVISSNTEKSCVSNWWTSTDVWEASVSRTLFA